MKSSIIFYSLLLLIFTSCATSQLDQNIVHSEINDAECTERMPSSETGLQCIKFFQSSSTKISSLNEFRKQRLTNDKLTLESAVVLLAPAISRAQVDHLSSYINEVNPNITLSQAKEYLTSKQTFWNRLKNNFNSTKNINEISEKELLIKMRDKDGWVKLFLLEAYLRFNPKSQVERSNEYENWFRILTGGSNSGFLTQVLKSEAIQSSRGLDQVIKLFKEAAEFKAKLSHSSFTLNEVSELLASHIERSKSEALLKTLIQSDQNLETTNAILTSFLYSKKVSPSQMMALLSAGESDARSLKLQSDTMARLLENPIESAQNTLQLFDTWWSQKFSKNENYKAAGQWLKQSANLRLKVDDQNNPKLYSLHISLLKNAKSSEQKKIAIDVLASSGEKALHAFLGTDSTSAQRMIYLLDFKPLSVVAKNEIQKFARGYYEKNLAGARAKSSGALKNKLEALFPDLKQKEIEATTALLTASEIQDISKIKSMVLRDQDSINSELQRMLASVLQANAPPDFFRSMPRPWTAYLKSLPAQIRAEHVWSLLEKNSDSTERLSNLIASLDPIEGVKDTVIRYLQQHRFTNSNRTDFSQNQIKKMFSQERFRKFFPHLSNRDLNGATRTKFIIAVRTSPAILLSNGLRISWLREKLDDNDVRGGVPEVFGFRPALQYSRLLRQLQEDLSGDDITAGPQNQIRGLIVQGHYEKTGNSMMYILNAQRGQAHIEESAPRIATQIERSLKTGNLSKESELLQKLFVVNWSLNTDASLINSIRNRAIRIAEMNNTFWDLRVEIHNFPTSDTLRRVKEFKERRGSSALASQLDAMIQELQSFLGESSNGDLQHILSERLVLRNQNRSAIVQLAQGFEKKNDIGKLKTLLTLRDQFQKIKQDSSSDNAKTEFILGDQALSEAATVIFSKWLESSDKSISSRTQVINLGLEHLVRDGIFSEKEVIDYRTNIEKVSKDTQTTDLEKIAFINTIVKGIIDQIYFRIEDEFGIFDNNIYRTVLNHDRPPPLKFVDNFMRSGMIFMLSKMVDHQAKEIAIAKKISHTINSESVQGLVDVYNPGIAVGVLRLNKDPMELSREDIAVFQQMPGEAAAVSGFVTIGVGARLSHLQLLSKSLKIPNAQVSENFLPHLKELDGKWVRLQADESGRLVIEEASQKASIRRTGQRIEVPKANHDIREPISFKELQDHPEAQYAGPKGVTLAKLFQNQEFNKAVPDGVVLPFGFFHEYAQKIGLQELLELLGSVNLNNRYLIGIITAQISNKIQANPIPAELLQKVKRSVDDLEKRTGHKLGYFFRSDTNVEDLPNFNGAGLNESVANVKNEMNEIDEAIRRVWISPYTEKSIYWRGEALGSPRVTLAEPSVVIMPTVEAQSSGVLITRGGPDWRSGHGELSANFGIGSVVEAGRPVEEFSFELGYPVRLSKSVSRVMPTASEGGGLKEVEVSPGTPVLSSQYAEKLNQIGEKVESILGAQDHGWDIEWAIDSKGRLIILQARPNM